MIRFLTPVVFVAAAACTSTLPPSSSPRPAPVAAPVPQLSAMERFIAAVEANGCVVNETNSPAILSQAALSRAEFEALTLQLAGEGKIEKGDGNSLRILSGNCI